MLTLFSIIPSLYGQRATEYQVKAAFLFNFSKFMEWPPEAFSSPDEPFIVGVLGNDPFGRYLDEIVTGEKILGHVMTVHRYNDISEINKCHILFINKPGKTAEIINNLKGKSILTVSDDPEFNQHGGIVKFYPENEMIKLQINVSAAKEANLNVSSKLLRIAKIYNN